MRQMLILKNQIVRSVEAMNIAYLKKCRKCGTFYASGRNAFLFCFLYIDLVCVCDEIIYIKYACAIFCVYAFL